MAHTLLYTMGYNAPKARLLPAKYDWKDKAQLDEALNKMTDSCAPGPSTSTSPRTTAP